MSQSSKPARSGLGTVRRDFSQPSLSQSSDVPWDPTPEAKGLPITGVDKRLKAIQDALADTRSKPMSSRFFAQPSSSSSAQKRASTSQSSTDAPAKRRQLPGSWSSSDPLTSRTNWVSKESSVTSAVSALSGTSIKASSKRAVATAKTSSKAAPVFLSKEQTHILNLVKDGASVFYTGSAGTGKSVLLREIIKSLRKQSKAPDAVAITASTGIAACNIGGVTIHSFAGFGLGEGTTTQLCDKIRKNKKAMARWARTKALIIDEVSMLDGDLFDRLAEIATQLRKIPEPFGGIQVIVTGDFFQLPPVTKGNTPVKFAFEAVHWGEVIQRTFNLTKVFRQTDQEFVDMLNEMRFGRLSHKSINKFRSLSRNIDYEDGLGPTELFPRREDVDRANSTRMNRLTGETRDFVAMDGGTMPDGPQKDKILANFMAPRNITLRVDSQVMLIKNMDETLVNGSMGKVVRFADPAIYGSEQDLNGGEQTDAKDKKRGTAAPTGIAWPVVQFIIPGQKRMREVLITPDVWKVEQPNGEIQVSRTQIPLILAWAMSIHKSQGQTLERVKVDLGKVFEKGQAYVALSRATSLDGLQVLNFDPKKVTVHPKVVEWSKTLETIRD